MLWFSVFFIRNSSVYSIKATGEQNIGHFCIRERRKSKHNFGQTKVCKAEEVRKYFINAEIENEFFG